MLYIYREGFTISEPLIVNHITSNSSYEPIDKRANEIIKYCFHLTSYVYHKLEQDNRTSII